MTDDHLDPADALKAIGQAQAHVADGFSRDTWGYDLTYSALAAGLIAATALGTPLNVAMTTICTLALVTLANAWKQKHGIWVSGLAPGATRWIALGMGAVILVIGITGLVLKERTQNPWPPLAGAALTFVIALAGSRLWRAAYRKARGLPA